jgi:serine/threonine-protein kinase
MSPGRVLSGRYVVGEVIGRGGMADVRVGRDLQRGRLVAIKALRSTSAADPLLRSSLRREAQLLGRLRHHAIVALHDTGTARAARTRRTRTAVRTSSWNTSTAGPCVLC